MSSSYETPMMQQYLKIKKEHSDCLLLFRLGDFYEMFMEDAQIGAKVLDITLTSRDRGKDGRIPMAGVPYHALDSYLSRLVKAGYKVAICEQVSEPNSKLLMDREVVRIVTSGTLVDERSLNKNENNYIVSVSLHGNIAGIAVADLSTGEFKASSHTFDNLSQLIIQEFSRFNPAECVVSDEVYNNPYLLKHLIFDSKLNIYPFANWPLFASDEKTARIFLEQHFGVATLHAYSLHDEPASLTASAGLLGYLKHTQKGRVEHIKKIAKYSSSDSVILDRATLVNLELFSTIRSGNKEGTLLSVLNKTSTAMGSRMLKKWITYPENNKEEIEERYSSVDHFVKNRFDRQELANRLEKIHDIERLLSRLSVGLGNAKDLIKVKMSLRETSQIKQMISSVPSEHLKFLANNIADDCLLVEHLIQKYIVEDPPTDVKEGSLINSGVNTTLDNLRSEIASSKEWIENLEQQEKARTGITFLKVKFNKVFGYFIEITKSNLASVPENYIRKQTMVNAERYITPELKEKEELVLTADEKINDLEYNLFVEVVNEVLKKVEQIQQTSDAISELDCLVSFAEISEKNNYCLPKLNSKGILEIIEGRHPVVEQLTEHNSFVPNDTFLDSADNQLLIITGPNMAGKSVYIRQVALIVLMAHIGCFVPAKSAKISIVDRIFVRSGASDVITEGLSTFMVEMIEAAYILNHATKDSLIIMDEIGRGTSTYDGISIASAITEYLVSHYKDGGPKTLFATHYHELQLLAENHSAIKNVQMAVKHENGEPVFLHKVIPGGASHSFGLAVAKMAGVPDKVLKNAKSILDKLEAGGNTIQHAKN